MKKKLVTLLCVTTLTASMLAGCGSKAETPAADTTTTEETTEAAEETADDADADQAAADNVAALIDKITFRREQRPQTLTVRQPRKHGTL